MEKEKSGSRYFTTMRNTWLCPRSVLWEYWTPLVACLVWIQYSCGMPHVIRIGKLFLFFPFYFSLSIIERISHTHTDAHTVWVSNLESCHLVLPVAALCALLLLTYGTDLVILGVHVLIYFLFFQPQTPASPSLIRAQRATREPGVVSMMLFSILGP